MVIKDVTVTFIIYYTGFTTQPIFWWKITQIVLSYEVSHRLSSICGNCNTCTCRGLVKEKYVRIILGSFSPSLHKTICCGYSLEVPRRGTSKGYPQHMVFWRNSKTISQNCHQIYCFSISLLTYVLKLFR